MRVVNATVKKSGWFVVEGDKDGSKFELTILTPGQERTIASKVQRVAYRGTDGASMEIDPVQSDTMRVTMALTGWDNVFDDAAGTRPFLFNQENKVKLLNGARIQTEEGIIDLQAWLLKKYQLLREDYEAELENERKNSVS